MNTIRFRTAVVDHANSVSILACVDDAGGDISHIGKRVNFEIVPHERGHVIPEGTIELDIRAAQSLLDSLIEAGMKPTKIANQAGEIARISDHLQDMRRLVFQDRMEIKV